MLSRRPPEDSGLPDRQICLSFEAPGYSTCIDNSFSIRVRVRHDDIRTAGKHAFSQRPDVQEAVEIRFEGVSTHDEDLNVTLRECEEMRKRYSDLTLRLKPKISLMAFNFGPGQATLSIGTS